LLHVFKDANFISIQYTSNWSLQRLKKGPIKGSHHYLTNLLMTDKRGQQQKV